MKCKSISKGTSNVQIKQVAASRTFSQTGKTQLKVPHFKLRMVSLNFKNVYYIYHKLTKLCLETSKTISGIEMLFAALNNKSQNI